MMQTYSHLAWWRWAWQMEEETDARLEELWFLRHASDDVVTRWFRLAGLL